MGASSCSKGNSVSENEHTDKSSPDGVSDSVGVVEYSSSTCKHGTNRGLMAEVEGIVRASIGVSWGVGDKATDGKAGAVRRMGDVGGVIGVGTALRHWVDMLDEGASVKGEGEAGIIAGRIP